jgi:hypothetical protein
VAGAFSFTSDGELPVFDFDYTQLLGADERVATIVSDGTSVVVEADGVSQTLGAAEAKSLRLGDDDGFADLGIASWVDDPTEERRGDETVVTGRVDAADLLSDLARIVAQVAGEGDVAPLEGDDAEALAKLVRSSEIDVVLAEDGLPSSIDAMIDFGGEVPEQLVDSLGPYAAASLHLVVELSRLDEALKVELPR